MSQANYDHVLGLRATRNFQDKPLADDDLDAVLEAARWTGSAKNVQGWAFVVVEGDDLSALAEAGSYTTPITNSAATIALIRTPEGIDFDIGRVAQNIMLGAAAIGVASCPITLHDEEVAHKVLGLPEGFHCRYAVALGYPDQPKEEAGRAKMRTGGWGGRKSRQDIVHKGRFGS